MAASAAGSRGSEVQASRGRRRIFSPWPSSRGRRGRAARPRNDLPRALPGAVHPTSSPKIYARTESQRDFATRRFVGSSDIRPCCATPVVAVGTPTSGAPRDQPRRIPRRHLHSVPAGRSRLVHPDHAAVPRPLPDPREDLRAQGQGGHPGFPDREELHQGGDLHALLQPGLLRERQLRRGGGQPGPLQQVDQGPDPLRGGAHRRPAPEPFPALAARSPERGCSAATT